MKENRLAREGDGLVEGCFPGRFVLTSTLQIVQVVKRSLK
jgi:hypothetical protein